MPQPDWAAQRLAMVLHQIEARGVRDPRVLRAMRDVPRHEFVPEAARASAYDDAPLSIGHGQTISQPFMVALMSEALRLPSGAKVLEIGTGSGYQAAILAEMLYEVHTIERDAELVAVARERLVRLGWPGVHVVVGDGTLGLPSEAPFDGILVTAGSPGVPLSLKQQLNRRSGALVIPVGDRNYQELLRIERNEEEFVEEKLGGCRFVPLVGEEGW
ncbi:MAG: protein-L-isoaspartate(D-aspartate) O-methyltransferase [Deltaproteobacteria bacterium]|nr:protein-L-isoaspartate(D-aspartate) O-methyltransferase [Deltaproteobacteria bacterium]